MPLRRKAKCCAASCTQRWRKDKARGCNGDARDRRQHHRSKQGHDICDRGTSAQPYDANGAVGADANETGSYCDGASRISVAMTRVLIERQRMTNPEKPNDVGLLRRT